MGKSNIPYVDMGWGITSGCTPCSDGCLHCWAAAMAHRFKLPWDVQTHPERLTEPLHWKQPKGVFVSPMGDLFHEQVPDEFIRLVFGMMQLADWHQFLVLTKRAKRMHEWCRGLAEDGLRLPLPNVQIGVTVENQARADERIPLLLATPAAHRWISYEPALGPLDLTAINYDNILAAFSWQGRIDAVVAGCESGPGARPAELDWFRQVRDQCVAAGVPLYLKQIQQGGKLVHLPELDGRQWLETPWKVTT